MTGDPHDDVDPDEATRISRRERAGSGDTAEDVTARSRRRDPEPPPELARRRLAETMTMGVPVRDDSSSSSRPRDASRALERRA